MEGAQAGELAARTLAQFDASPDHVAQQEAGFQFVQKGRRECHSYYAF